MYGHSCRVAGRGGVGPLRFGGASLCWGRSVTTDTHRLVVAGAALGVHPPRHGVSDQVWPPVDGGHPDPAPRGGRALAVWGGAWGALVSGDVEEGVEEEVLTPSPRPAA